MSSGFEYHPKSEARKRGLAYYKNKNFAVRQRCVILSHGIDEANSEDLAGVKRSSGWGGWLNIIAMAEKYSFNIIWTNSSQDNTTDEIDYAIAMAEEDLSASFIHLLGFSWGGRRIRLWVSRNLEAAKKISTVMRISSGGVDVDDWTNTIAAKLPTWLLHAVDDERTTYKNTLVSYQNAVAMDPSAPVWYTQFNAGQDTVWKGHNMLQKVGDWKIASPASATYLNNPVLTLSQWWEMNEWRRGTDPSEKYIPKPVQVPAPVVEKKAAFVLYDDGTWEKV